MENNTTETTTNTTEDTAKSTENTTKTRQSGNPPTRPNENTSSGDATNEVPTDMGTPPEMNCEDETNCEMPTPPEGMDGETSEMPGDMQGEPMGDMMQLQSTGTSNVLHPAAYLLLGAGSLMLGIVISYAVFSKFFTKKPAQTFRTWQRFVWFAVVAVVLTVGLAALCYFIPVWVSQ